MVSPLLSQLQNQQPLLWLNPGWSAAAPALSRLAQTDADIDAAHALLERWRPALAQLFPQLAPAGGLIESTMQRLEAHPLVLASQVAGSVWLKQDHQLPVAGSIKARGGIFEVLCFAEDVMQAQGIAWDSEFAPLQAPAQQAFASRTVSVGSTGNLGLSIGVMARALGFRSVVHMSGNARPWKKERLGRCGVEVREHAGDFTDAVRAGRVQAALQRDHYFVDDEHSVRLLLGYAVAARRLAVQLAAQDIAVDAEHPLFVYLPCGVGGAPAGITLGLKHMFGDAVHCFFAEPCAAPSMLARLALPDTPTIYRLGLDGQTQADGLAVAQASELAAEVTQGLASGIFTVTDQELLRYLYRLHRATGIAVEVSATAGFAGPQWIQSSPTGHDYLRLHALEPHMSAATHLLWTTGGLFMPDEEFAQFLAQGRELELAAQAQLQPVGSRLATNLYQLGNHS